MLKQMKHFLLLIVLSLLAGCEVDQETRDFYYSGWVNPQEGSNMRMYGSKKGPQEYGGSATTPTDDLTRLTPAAN